MCGSSIPTPIDTVAKLICAIERANDEFANPGQDVLSLSVTTFTFNIGYLATDNALPIITSDIVINGNGSIFDTAYVFGDNFRFFAVDASGGILRLVNLTLQNAYAVNSGGAIYNDGILRLNGVTFIRNVSDINGGAVYHAGTTLMIDNSVFTQNEGVNGGALAASGSLVNPIITITGSVFDSNSASANGGGIYYDPLGFGMGLTLDFTRIVNNAATNVGGGLYADQFFSMGHGTVNSNTAASAGGIFSCNSDGGAQIVNSTISRNNADGLETCLGGSTDLSNTTVSTNTGDGIVNGFVSLLFVTVANNTGTGVSLGNGSLRNSLIVGNSTDCATFTYILSGVNMDTDSSCGGATRTLAQIELGALGDNGGVTETHALGDTSSAVNKAVDCTDFSGSISVTNDQIAQTRPGNSDCDLGSYENQTGGGGVGAAEAAEVPTEALPPTAESTLEVTAEVTPEVTVEVTLEVTPEPTPEVTSEVEITPEVTDIVVPPTIEVTLTPVPPTFEPTATEIAPTAEATPDVEVTAEMPPPETTDTLEATEAVPSARVGSSYVLTRAFNFRAWLKPG